MKKPLSRQQKTGIISSVTTIIVVACLVAVNIISSLLTEKYPIKIDLTQDKIFQLTEESISYINEIEKDIVITVMNTRDSFSSGNEYFEQALSVIEQYEKYNENIQVEYLDLMANPTLAQQYGDLSVQVNDIVVQCGDNTQKLTVYDLFNIEQSWYGGSITSSNAEQAMTGAIMNISSDDKPMITFLSGHEELVNYELEDMLLKTGYEVSTITLLTENIPEDTELLIAIAPNRDYSIEEIEKLDAFMKKSGESSMFYFASSEQPSLPNIEGFLASWGLEIGTELVAETSQDRLIGNNAFLGIADIDDYTVTENMASYGIALVAPFARPISYQFSSNMGYTTQSLLSYSSTSGLVDESIADISEVDIIGPISVAGKSSYSGDGVNSSLFVFGTDQLINSNFLDNQSLSNMDFLISLLSTTVESENMFFIAPKTLGGLTFTLLQSEILIYTLFLMILLPVFVLGGGITIWIKRRRR